MQLKVFRKLILLEQSLFALPWVLVGAILPSLIGEPIVCSWYRCLWMFVSFFSARTAGMSFNRLIDREIDAKNPRTKNRVLPAGEATLFQVRVIAWGSTFCFVVACSQINNICLAFSPLIVFLLWVYSYTKRFTACCHLVLGGIQFLGPVLAWAAVTDQLQLLPVLLGSALFASIVGSDVIYALQDYTFDREQGLYSLPVAVGRKKALWIARGLHFVAIVFLVLLGLQINTFFLAGVVGVAGVYLYYHRFSENIPIIFFRCNTFVGIVLFVTTLGMVLWRVML